jgi:hypothetical protein
MVQFAQQKPETVFLLLVLAEIHKRGKVLHHVTRLIQNRANKEGGPEHAAILATETNFKFVFGAARKRGFDLRKRPRIDGAPHQKIEALTEHLLPVISG